jgi:hypothetical protein
MTQTPFIDDDVGDRVSVYDVAVDAVSGTSSSLYVWDFRTTIGELGAPKRVATLSIHCAVDLLSHPRCWPQSAQCRTPA